MLRRLGFGLIVASAVAGCGVPLPADRHWVEARSKHFVVKTDVGEGNAQDLVRGFERSYAAVRGAMSAGATTGLTHVIVMKYWNDFDQIRPGDVGAYFYSDWHFPATPRTIVIPLRELEETPAVFQHELTHRFINEHYPAAPAWLNEGMAEYYSTVRIDGDSLVIGEPPSQYSFDGFNWIVDHRVPFTEAALKFDDLISAPYAELRFNYYLSAWALVHVLMLGDPEFRARTDRYLALLRTGTSSSANAFSHHFDPAFLEYLSEHYTAFMARRGAQPTTTRPFAAPPDASIDLRVMSPGERHALWGRLRPDDPENFVRAMRDAERAIQIDPNSIHGYLLRADLYAASDPKTEFGKTVRAYVKLPDKGLEEAVEDQRKALALAPNEPMVLGPLLLRLLQTGGKPEEIEAIAAKLTAIASNSYDFDVLAKRELVQGRPAQGLVFAKASLERDRACGGCLETLAAAAFLAKDYELAVFSQRRAINILAHEPSEKLTRHLAMYEKARLKALGH